MKIEINIKSENGHLEEIVDFSTNDYIPNTRNQEESLDMQLNSLKCLILDYMGRERC